MPPSPGHIHQLPVKVLYSLDGASQSYLTVLGELQDVYIHPGLPSYGSDEEPGPVGSTLLKALAQGVCHASPECAPNPSLDFSVYSLDPSPPSRRPQAQPFNTQTEEISWSGKGFLSWALTEPASGSTLIKGRLVKEYDFDLSRFQEGGGLEGLMRAGGGDGRGWGLEVVLTLKMVRGEFGGKREFERMLYNPTAGLNSNAAVNPTTIATTRPPASSPRTRPILPPPPPPRATTSPHRPGSAGPGQSSNTNTNTNMNTNTNTNANGGPVQRIVRPPPAPSRSSLPPSSAPMAPSSSSQPPSRPSSSAKPMSDAGRTPTNGVGVGVGVGIGVGVGAGRPPAPSGPTSQAGPSRHPTPQSQHTITPPKPTPKPPPPPPLSSSTRNRNREITPPPLPRPRSPPPTTPHRRALRDLLQADGKMSPSLAKDLVNNPSLLALLKSIPTTGGKGKEKEKEVKSENDNGREGTPTPTAPKSKVESIPGGCFNCGTLETSMWRVKTYADGTKKKVCDACGLYFNKTKKMRPKELWDQAESSISTSTSSAIKRPAPVPVRQSPRLSRTTDTPALPPPPESPSKRRRVSKPIPHPSPRMATRSTGVGRMDPFPFSSPATSQFGGNGNGGFGTSPAVPLDSSHSINNDTRNGISMNGTNAEGMGMGMDMDLDALLAQLTSATSEGGGGGGDGMDLGFNLPAGINLEELFATVDNAAKDDDALAEDMMKFFAGLEGDQSQSQTQSQGEGAGGGGDGVGNGDGDGKGSGINKANGDGMS